MRAKLTDGRQTINPKNYYSKELEGLPDPVQRYFHVVLKDGQPIVAAVNLTQRGLFNYNQTVGARSFARPGSALITNIFILSCLAQSGGNLQSALAEPLRQEKPLGQDVSVA